MGARYLAVIIVLILAAGVIAAMLVDGRTGLGRQEPSPAPSAAGTSVPAADSSMSSAPSPSAATPSPYTFQDEFDGPVLSPVWRRHFTCCGTLAGLDESLTTISDGVLSMSVDRRTDGWYGDLIDTKTTWTQLYGYFEARIKIPKGPGLWPAFWSYFSGDGTTAEIDTMEVCDGASADGSVLYNGVHWSARDSETHRTMTRDLTTDFHVYGVDWRASHITFYLDGTPVWSFRQARRIPSVPLPLILNLGVGGDFCGPTDSTTPDGARMLVDWVRAKP